MLLLLGSDSHSLFSSRFTLNLFKSCSYLQNWSAICGAEKIYCSYNHIFVSRFSVQYFLPTQIIVFYFTFYLQAVKTNDYQCIDVIGKDLYISRVWMRRTGFYPFLLILLYKKDTHFISMTTFLIHKKFRSGHLFCSRHLCECRRVQ